jgi:hypothetical protein
MRIFRVRVHDPANRLLTAAELGTPSRGSARFSNRMSPAGIPMFYGAFDEQTAIAETYDASQGNQVVITVAEFVTARDFPVLDLTKLPQIPSLFDSDRRDTRPGLIFLNDFISDLSAPIEKNGREHIEYVPTQVVTEFFRHCYKHPTHGAVRGILYKSAQRTGGDCCVLFFESDHCCDMHRR